MYSVMLVPKFSFDSGSVFTFAFEIQVGQQVAKENTVFPPLQTKVRSLNVYILCVYICEYTRDDDHPILKDCWKLI